jgi:hypothetical protein
MLVQFIARIIFQKDYIVYEMNLEHNNPLDSLFLRIRELLLDDNICAAEDALYDGFDGSDDYMKLAVWFYSELNTKTDEELEAAGFSRAEIDEGLRDVLHRYSIVLSPGLDF